MSRAEIIMAEAMGISVEQYIKYELHKHLINVANLCGSQYSQDFGNSGQILQIPIVTDKGIYISISGNYTDSIMLDGTIIPNATKCSDNEYTDNESLVTCMEIEDGNIPIVAAEIADAENAIAENAIAVADTDVAIAVEAPIITSIDGMRLHKGCLNIQYIKKIYGWGEVVKLDIYKDKKCSPIARIGTIHIHKDSIDWAAPVFIDPTTL